MQIFILDITSTFGKVEQNQKLIILLNCIILLSNLFDSKMFKNVNSNDIRIYNVLCSIITVVLLATFLSLYFAGYEVRKDRNERLLLTNCSIVNNTYTGETCWKKCTYNRKSQCPYTCYYWRQVGEYDLSENKFSDRHTFIYNKGKNRNLNNIIEIFEKKPIGYGWDCYYDPKNLDIVIDSKYNVKAWRGVSLAFGVLLAISLSVNTTLMLWDFERSYREKELSESEKNKIFVNRVMEERKRARQKQESGRSLYRSAPKSVNDQYSV